MQQRMDRYFKSGSGKSRKETKSREESVRAKAGVATSKAGASSGSDPAVAKSTSKAGASSESDPAVAKSSQSGVDPQDDEADSWVGTLNPTSIFTSFQKVESKGAKMMTAATVLRRSGRGRNAKSDRMVIDSLPADSRDFLSSMGVVVDVNARGNCGFESVFLSLRI